MLLTAFARAIGVASLIFVATSLFAGCGSEQDVKYASVAATSKPTPQPTLNPDQATGLVTRFYRDAEGFKRGNRSVEPTKDLITIVSIDFLRNHSNDFIADYAFICDPKVQIHSVIGRTVAYTLDYVYETQGAGKLYWERTGRWTFNHGAKSGWVLDRDVWDSVHLVGISTPKHPDIVAVQDKVYSDGRHEFTYQGEALSFLAQGDHWHITAVATPTPTPMYDSNVAGESGGDRLTFTPEAAAAPDSDGQQSSTSYKIPPPLQSSADCEEVDVDGVYDDGKVLALDDGRHLRVDDTDTVTSNVWTAPFDGLICDDGDRFINKDDNEGVDLAP
jgi:hypothetical protein